MIENDTRPDPQSGDDDEIVRAHEQSLGYVLGRAHLLFRQRMIKALEGTGLHMGQVVILASLSPAAYAQQNIVAASRSID